MGWSTRPVEVPTAVDSTRVATHPRLLLTLLSVSLVLTACAGQADVSDPGASTGDASVVTSSSPTGPEPFPDEPTATDQSFAEGGDEPTIADSADLTPATFPLAVDPTGNHLVDADGDPFLIHGDAAWSLVLQLDSQQTADYLSTRRDQGFNALVVNLIEHEFADDPPRDEAGRDPFLSPGDFSAPNDAYFDAAVDQVRQAADEGFMVLLAPAYLGFDGGSEGWYQDMLTSGEQVMEDYGRYVGEKFADADNVIWLHAGDYSPPPEGLRLVEAVDRGLSAAGATQLRTAHGSPGDSASDLGLDIALDIDATYTYDLTYLGSREDETDGVDIPHFLFETAYETERDLTRQQFRAQAYGPLLSGAVGQVYGHSAIWQFVSTWREALEAPGAQDQVHVRTLFERLPWPQLEPDLNASVVVEGSGNYGQGDFAIAASTPGRQVTVVYLPALRTIGLDLQQDPSGATVQWYDPVDGTTVDADPELTSTGLRVTPPGPNAGGDDDWVLLVETTGDGVPEELSRVEGSERISTAVAVSQRVLDGAGAVVLASAANFPDALVSAPLAIAEDAALLLTDRSSVPQVTLDEIERLGAGRVIVLGGPAAIDEEVVRALRQRGLDVERTSGEDRIATAVAAAQRSGGQPPVVVLASGFAFPDGLSGAALAGALGAPLLLTDGTTVSPATADVIGQAEVLVVGGPAVVAERVLDDLRDQGADVTRLGGDGRYDTSRLAAEEAAGRTGQPASVWIATGRDFPDALSAAAAAVRDDGVVLLTEGLADAVPTATGAALGSFGTCRSQVRLVGGTAAISTAHEGAIAGLLGC